MSVSTRLNGRRSTKFSPSAQPIQPICIAGFVAAFLVLALPLVSGSATAQTTPPPVEPDAPKPAEPAKPRAAAANSTTKSTADAPVITGSQTVPTVEVTGKRGGNEDRRASTAAKIIISREDIEQYGDSNLGDVLRRLPGVTQGGRPGRGGPVQMRGMGGGFTQILIDGERVAPGFSVEQITPEQVERIEILRAPTAETGARAIAGTINIILREPLRARNNDIRASIQDERGYYSSNLSWSRNDTLSATGTYNMTLSAGHTDQLTDTSTRTNYSNTTTGATALDQDGFNQSHDKRNNIFLSSRFQWRLGAGEQFSLQPFLVHSESNSHSRGTLTQSVGATPAQYATNTGDSDARVTVARFMSMLNKRIDQDTRYELRGSGGQFSLATNAALNQFDKTGLRTLSQTTDGDAKDRSWNITGKLSRSLFDGKHSLVTGGELEGVKRTENSTTLLNGVRQLVDFGTELNVSTQRTALYIQDEWDPSPNWSSYLGLRWETIKTESDGSGSGTANPAVRNKSSVLTPLAQGVWRFDAPSRDQVRLALTQSYRAPTTQNLVSRPSLNILFPVPGANTSVSADRAGNPNLRPELANGVDLAYEKFLKSGGIVSVNLFTRHIKDLIRNVTTLESVSWASSPRFVSRPQNLGNAVTSGIEFDAKFQLTEVWTDAIPLNIRANASVFDSKVHDVNGPNNRIDQQPRSTANLGADYRFRGTPFSIGGNVALTPAYDTQQTNTQLQKNSAKRVIDFYGLWSVDSATRLRLTLSNLSPRGLTTTTAITEDNQRQIVASDARTDLSVALRLEMRL